MNTLIIHGENVQDSYQRFKDITQKVKEKGWEVEHSLDNLRATSLFTKKRAFILYFDSKLPLRELKKFPKESKIEEFKLPKVIFKFLESFYPGNVKTCLTLLHELVRKEPPEFIMALLARHLKNLFWVKLGSQSSGLQNWQIERLRPQAGRFPAGLLEEIIRELAKIDIEVKSSNVELIPSLDLLIITKLK